MTRTNQPRAASRKSKEAEARRAVLAELPFTGKKVGPIVFKRLMNLNPPLEGPSKSTRKLLSAAKALPSTSPVSYETPKQRADLEAALRSGNELVRQLDKTFAESPVRRSATGIPMPASREEVRDISVERAAAAPEVVLPGIGVFDETPAGTALAGMEASSGGSSSSAIPPMGRPQSMRAGIGVTERMDVVRGIGVTERAPFPERPMGPMGMPISGKGVAAAALGAAALYGLTRLLAGRKSDETPARTNGDKKGPIVSRKPISKFAPTRGAYKKGGVVKKRNVKKGAVRQTIKKMARKR